MCSKFCTHPPIAAALTIRSARTGNQSFLTLMTSTGGKLVLMYKFDAARAADLICREKLLSAGGVPNLVAQILDEIDRQGRWNEVVLEGISYGGGPPSSKLPAVTKQRIPNAMAGQGYGLTGESVCLLSHVLPVLSFADEIWPRRGQLRRHDHRR